MIPATTAIPPSIHRALSTVTLLRARAQTPRRIARSPCRLKDAATTASRLPRTARIRGRQPHSSQPPAAFRREPLAVARTIVPSSSGWLWKRWICRWKFRTKSCDGRGSTPFPPHGSGEAPGSFCPRARRCRPGGVDSQLFAAVIDCTWMVFVFGSSVPTTATFSPANFSGVCWSLNLYTSLPAYSTYAAP
jgi:hypothetical protein